MWRFTLNKQYPSALSILFLFICSVLPSYAQGAKQGEITLTVQAYATGSSSSSTHNQSGEGDSFSSENIVQWTSGTISFKGAYYFDPLTLDLIRCETGVSGSGSGGTVDTKHTAKATREIDAPQQARTQTNIQKWSSIIKDTNKKRCAPSSISIDFDKGTCEIPSGILSFVPGSEEMPSTMVNRATDTFDKEVSYSTSDLTGLLTGCPVCAVPGMAVMSPATMKNLKGTFRPGAKSFSVSGNVSYSLPPREAQEEPKQGNTSDKESKSESMTGDVSLHWTLSYHRESDLELVITPVPGYPTWLPIPGKDENTLGPKPLGFTAELRNKKSPDKPVIETAWFRLELDDTTREPGICMNAPSSNPAKSFDLRILSQGDDEFVKSDPNGQWAETKKGLRNCGAAIACFDGGAYGRLRITAYTEDGQTVVGHLKGEEDVTEITIPMDKDNDHIADEWEKKVGFEDQSPADDTDEQPDGDLNLGDGLTFFEEYRGFLEDSKHIRTDPRKKDLFVRNTLQGEVVNGIRWMSAVTGLDVHYKLKASELGDDRVINKNHGNAPHVVDQHGIKIVQGTDPTTSMAVGGPGTPKSITQVEIATSLMDWKPGTGSAKNTITNYVARITAHELLHCCNVWHHGDIDIGKVLWKSVSDPMGWRITEYTDFTAAADGSFTTVAPGEGVNVFRENGNQIEPDQDMLKKGFIPGWLADKKGQHSGVEDCLMRYDCAGAYKSSIGGCRYLAQGDEVPGMFLCDDKAGTGVNKTGRSPEPRHGDSEKGKCKDQICVNDLYY